jgi:hypothetical protein
MKPSDFPGFEGRIWGIQLYRTFTTTVPVTELYRVRSAGKKVTVTELIPRGGINERPGLYIKVPGTLADPP